jgi:hypothetical protein
MRSVSPRIDGADEYTIAENQLEYMPVVACQVQFSDGKIARVLRYTFTHEERAKIAAGEDLYFGTPATIQLVPHWFTIGFP